LIRIFERRGIRMSQNNFLDHLMALFSIFPIPGAKRGIYTVFYRYTKERE